MGWNWDRLGLHLNGDDNQKGEDAKLCAVKSGQLHLRVDMQSWLPCLTGLN